MADMPAKVPYSQSRGGRGWGNGRKDGEMYIQYVPYCPSGRGGEGGYKYYISRSQEVRERQDNSLGTTRTYRREVSTKRSTFILTKREKLALQSSRDSAVKYIQLNFVITDFFPFVR
jgi:hypothetical protein